MRTEHNHKVIEEFKETRPISKNPLEKQMSFGYGVSTTNFSDKTRIETLLKSCGKIEKDTYDSLNRKFSKPSWIFDVKNQIMSYQVFEAICIAIIHAKFITGISFDQCGLNQVHFKILELLLAHTNRITLLEIRNNKISEVGMEAMTNGLSKNRSITDLRLESCFIEEKGYSLLSAILCKNKTITKLSIPHNMIKSSSLSSLLIAIRTLPIEALKLSYCNLDNSHLDSLKSFISNTETLRLLDLSGNSFGEKIKDLGNALSYNHYIQVLVLNENSLKGEFPRISLVK